jgi:succinyl-CoA synthetase beta subunit
MFGSVMDCDVIVADKKMLAESGLKIIAADSTADGAEKVVKAVKK